ncbi:hypothetical protein [Pseudoxanthomonas koreensis]|uniref:hypothetical protein n=1 Tax=Pseudoxanthomonas koreensis TaxID=266061 RepID=UPI0013907380|nr:hypothetical protein [Pseudoxanthomonas koreensis]KAF1690209.1 hypothetical protein CSC64_11705 [Pseudoxanthomonas koreensis]
MKKIHCLGLLALAFAFDATAQDAACPALPSGSDLHWEQKNGTSFTLCRALDGERPVLSVMFTADSVPKPPRRNRLEEGRIGSHEVYWYMPDVIQGGQAKRIAFIELDDDRYAQVWVDAGSDVELRQLLVLAQNLPLH